MLAIRDYHLVFLIREIIYQAGRAVPPGMMPGDREALQPCLPGHDGRD
jgi:hypothetical protein